MQPCSMRWRQTTSRCIRSSTSSRRTVMAGADVVTELVGHPARVDLGARELRQAHRGDGGRRAVGGRRGVRVATLDDQRQRARVISHPYQRCSQPGSTVPSATLTAASPNSSTSPTARCRGISQPRSAFTHGSAVHPLCDVASGHSVATHAVIVARSGGGGSSSGGTSIRQLPAWRNTHSAVSTGPLLVRCALVSPAATHVARDGSDDEDRCERRREVSGRHWAPPRRPREV